MDAVPIPQSQKRKFGFSGAALKLLACVIMLIDHAACVIIPEILKLDIGYLAYNRYLSLYSAMRLIGRLAFPIYCYLLVEGFSHTSNKKKYLSRLLLFAAVSEIPFDLCFSRTLLELTYQNVYFTLSLGMLAMMLISRVRESTLPKFVRELLSALIAACCCALGYLLKTDYGAFGVASIIVLYIVHERRLVSCGVGSIVFSWEKSAPLAFVPILLYNGERGHINKYFFYAFYPAHLLLLKWLAWMISIW